MTQPDSIPITITYAAQDDVRDVMLTFDDGPVPGITTKILDILAEYEIKATFFVIGGRLHADPARDLVVRAHEAGHVIANHTYTHPNLRRLSDTAIRTELRRTHALIEDLVGAPTLFRPPYGATDSRVDAIIAAEGYNNVMWNVDTLDWQKRSIAWVNHGMRQIRAREDSLVLMHDIHATTAAHVEMLITQILALDGETRFVQYDAYFETGDTDEPEADDCDTKT